jgi:dephospho-CoA kinase
MKTLGLIGGMGAGKSVVRAELAALGARVIDADRVGHEVYEPGTPGFTAVVAAFGPGIVDSAGRIDRRALGALVFADAAELARLNAIVHPLIRAEIEQRLAEFRRAGDAPAVVVEAAVLLEAGWDALVDEIWLVVAARVQVIERLLASRGLSAAEVETRLARQMGDAERRRAADVVIENDRSLEDLRERVRALWRERIVVDTDGSALKLRP